jgi:hypothetical protein
MTALTSFYRICEPLSKDAGQCLLSARGGSHKPSRPQHPDVSTGTLIFHWAGRVVGNMLPQEPRLEQ